MPTNVLALDTETTGVDLYNGAKPFYVATCNSNAYTLCWEWEVDPFTREPKVPQADVKELYHYVMKHDLVIMQNSKFDVTGLSTLGTWGRKLARDWPWEKTRDTLMDSHILGSNLPHDLTNLILQYLAHDIELLEKRLETAVKEARTMARHHDWAIADSSRSDMPSASQKTWRFDYWLPKAISKQNKYGPNHPWQTVLAEYANPDAEALIPLWEAMQRELARRELDAISAIRQKLLRLNYVMEETGLTGSVAEHDRLLKQYQKESLEAEVTCEDIATEYDYSLTLPKSGNNKSLTTFVFEKLELPAAGYTKSGNKTLDKSALEHYVATLPQGSKALEFIEALQFKRKRDTAVSYLQGYRRYWHLTGKRNEWFTLHPSLNPTGTSTLRWSSSHPNEQNISKQEEKCKTCNGRGCRLCYGTGVISFNLRRAFGPTDDEEWWSFDAKNIELRIPAYKADEEELIALFERPDEPPYYGSNHLLAFHTLHPDKWAEMEAKVGFEKVGPACKKEYASTWYQWTKNGNFAVQYGAVESSGTADRAYHVPGAQRKMMARFTKQAELNKRCIKHAERFGYVETVPDKTVDPNRGYPLLCTRSESGYILPTVPLNYYVQGTAMWWMMKAMIRCQEYLDQLNRAAGAALYAMVMQVHDELVFRFPKGRGKEPWKTNLPKIRKIKHLMEMGGDDLGLPTPVSCEYHAKSWGEGRSIF